MSLLSGLYLKDILARIFPDKNLLILLRSYLPLVIVLNIFLRIVISPQMTWDIRPYLHWPISKKRLTLVFFILNTFNKYTFGIILFLAVFSINLLLTSFNSYLLIFNFILINIYVLVFSELFLFAFKKTGNEPCIRLYIFFLINVFFSFAFIRAKIPFEDFLICILCFINIVYMVLNHNDYYNLYYPNASRAVNYKTQSYFNPYFTIILKSIKRNSVIGKTLLYYGLCILGGSIYFLQSLDNKVSVIFILIALMICSGSLVSNLIVTYQFSWDYNWRGFIFSKPIKISDYVNANLIFATLLCLIPTILYLIIYLIGHFNIFLFISAFSLYGILLNFVQVVFSILYYCEKDPHFSTIGNPQPARFFLFIFIIIPACVLYYFNGVNFTINDIGIKSSLLIGALGGSTLISSPIWFRYIRKYFYQKKYTMLNR